MTADLIAFLRARLDEDEQVARAATAGPWSTMGRRVLDPTPPSDRLGVGMAVGHAAATADFNETAAHIARWDPHRVLAEAEAKRKTLELHPPQELTGFDVDGWEWTGNHCPECGGEDWPCGTVRALLAIYGDHPDFNPAWLES